jgi:hypothetical protein
VLGKLVEIDRQKLGRNDVTLAPVAEEALGET